jgi:hypothetical protein
MSIHNLFFNQYKSHPYLVEVGLLVEEVEVLSGVVEVRVEVDGAEI